MTDVSDDERPGTSYQAAKSIGQEDLQSHETEPENSSEETNGLIEQDDGVRKRIYSKV